MVLLLFRRNLASDLKGRISGDTAKAPDPAARAFIGNEGKRRAVFERSNRCAQRTADDLTSPALEFEAGPAVIFIGAAEFQTERDSARDRKLVAAAISYRQVERVPTAGFCIAVLFQLEIVDRQPKRASFATEPDADNRVASHLPRIVLSMSLA